MDVSTIKIRMKRSHCFTCFLSNAETIVYNIQHTVFQLLSKANKYKACDWLPVAKHLVVTFFVTGFRRRSLWFKPYSVRSH